METRQNCPRCGRPLEAAGRLEGLCPQCLLRQDPFVTHEAVPDCGSAVPSKEEVQRHFPDLKIHEQLGHGGMGVVYKARQTRLDRWVALKLLRPKLAENPSFSERFGREAKTLARLRHPNIVAIHDFGEKDGLWYLLMEYVDGLSLRALLERGTLEPQEALAIVPQICAGLEYAHGQGVVHRDIKPENILLDQKGQVQIADFGLAKLVGKSPFDPTLTRTSQVMGTPHYMAPEQLRKPLDVDHRADLYSLGVVLYEMLTRQLPVGQFPLPSECVQVDVRLDQVVLKALQQQPEQRYQRAQQMQTDLADLETPLPAAQTGNPLPAQSQGSDPFSGWVYRVPGGAAGLARVALVAAWGWWLFMEYTPAFHSHWWAVAYPFAYLAFSLGLTTNREHDFPARRFFLLLCLLTMVAVIVRLSGDWERSFQEQSGDILAAIVMVGAHSCFDVWVRRGRLGGLVAAIAVGLVGAIMHGSMHWNAGREMFYYGSGIGAMLASSSAAVLIPASVWDEQADGNSAGMARGFAPALLFAAMFFNRYLF